MNGASAGSRTPYLLITNQLLCRVSYAGKCLCEKAFPVTIAVTFIFYPVDTPFYYESAALPTELSWRPASIAKKETLCQEGRQAETFTLTMIKVLQYYH